MRGRAFLIGFAFCWASPQLDWDGEGGFCISIGPIRFLVMNETFETEEIK